VLNHILLFIAFEFVDIGLSIIVMRRLLNRYCDSGDMRVRVFAAGVILTALVIFMPLFTDSAEAYTVFYDERYDLDVEFHEGGQQIPGTGELSFTVTSHRYDLELVTVLFFFCDENGNYSGTGVLRYPNTIEQHSKESVTYRFSGVENNIKLVIEGSDTLEGVNSGETSSGAKEIDKTFLGLSIVVIIAIILFLFCIRELRKVNMLISKEGRP
jgi:hypothetical protein